MFSARFYLLTFAALWLWGCAPEQKTTLSIPAPMVVTPEPAPTTKAVPAALADKKPTPQKKLSPELESLLHPKPPGLSLAQQKAMFYEEAEGENKNERELDKRYPLEVIEHSSPSESGQKYVLDRAAYSAKLDDKLYNHIMKKYHLTYGQMCEINGRGVDEKWPCPPISD